MLYQYQYVCLYSCSFDSNQKSDFVRYIQVLDI